MELQMKSRRALTAIGVDSSRCLRNFGDIFAKIK